MSSSGGFDRLLLNGIADLEKATTPEDVSAADVPDGLTRAAALDALHVNLIWTIVKRLANAFGFQLPLRLSLPRLPHRRHQRHRDR